MKKNAFTVIELLIFLVMLCLLSIIAMRVLVRKVELAANIPTSSNEIICTCDIQKTCFYDFQKEDNVKFASIDIIGGGASGNKNPKGKGGGAGESKTIYYPTLIGKYAVVLGQGGNIEKNKNGGATLFYKFENGKYRLLEFARGGTYNNEIYANKEMQQFQGIYSMDDKQLGETALLHQGSFSNCGAGGNVGSNGKGGEVVIRW